LQLLQHDGPSPLDQSVADLRPGSQTDDFPLLVHHVGVEAKTGHLVVNICPLVTLENKLLHAMVVYPARGDPTILKPKCTILIPLDTRGGVIARLRGGTLAGKGDLHAIPIVCPPLGDQLDNDFEIDAEDSAGDMVYVRNFGEASEFILPSDGSMLACYLVADASSRPTLALQILPRGTVANDLSVEACLQVSPWRKSIGCNVRLSCVKQNNLPNSGHWLFVETNSTEIRNLDRYWEGCVAYCDRQTLAQCGRDRAVRRRAV